MNDYVLRNNRVAGIIGRVLPLLGGALFNTVVQVLLRSFSCTLPSTLRTTGFQSTLVADSTVQCWTTWTHWGMIISSGVSLALYVPQAVHNAPLFQALQLDLSLLCTPSFLSSVMFLRVLLAIPRAFVQHRVFIAIAVTGFVRLFSTYRRIDLIPVPSLMLCVALRNLLASPVASSPPHAQ